MSTLTVGTGQQYATIEAAVAASSSGDTIDVTAGTYTNDFVTISHNLTIQAVGGPVDLVATAQPPNGKAIIDEGGSGVSVTLSGLTLSGATVPDENGAGVRYEGGTLLMTNDTVTGNQDGILGAPDPNGSITIQDSTFSGNGNGQGNTHNIYVGAIASFTLQGSLIEDAVVGHDVKSRAASNTITGNTIVDGSSGTASYEIDLPNGGVATISGNAIEKGPDAQNPVAVSYGEEGMTYSTNSLAVTDNVMESDYTAHITTAVRNSASGVTANVSGNTFYGWNNLTGGPASLSGNVVAATEPALTSTAGAVTATLSLSAAASATLGNQPWATPFGVETVTGTLATGNASGSVAGQTVTLTANGQALATAAPVVTNALGQFTATFALPAQSVTLAAASQDAAGDPASASITVDGGVNAPLFGAVSTSASSVPGEVYALYGGILDRAPDSSGLQTWTDAGSAGLSGTALAQALLSSAEFTARFGQASLMSPTQFVTMLYADALHRAPDPGGLQTWVNALSGGETQAQVAAGIALSPESIGDIQPTFLAAGGAWAPNETDASIARLSWGLLGQAPDATALSGYEAAVAGGESLVQVAQAMMASSAFQPYAGETNTQFVTQLYADALGRAPDSSGLQSWVGALNAGMSRTSVAVGISNSPEASLHLIPVVEAGCRVA